MLAGFLLLARAAGRPQTAAYPRPSFSDMARIVLSLLALQPSVGGLQSPRRPIASTCARPSVSPAAAAASGPSFSELPLPEWLVDRTEALGYTHATPVQATAIGPLIDRRDAVVLAQTGSGKTLAYMLPLLASLRPSASVQALVLAPSRELAAQVAIRPLQPPPTFGALSEPSRSSPAGGAGRTEAGGRQPGPAAGDGPARRVGGAAAARVDPGAAAAGGRPTSSRVQSRPASA